MPSTPTPLYLDPQIDLLLADGILHKFDVLLNYAHTHGRYLLDDSQFRIFQITCETTKALDPILRELHSSIEPQTHLRRSTSPHSSTLSTSQNNLRTNSHPQIPTTS